MVRRLLDLIPIRYFTDPEVILRGLVARWNEKHRAWHNASHLVDLLNRIEAEEHGEDREILLLAALFHDAVYDPRSAKNEEESAELLLQSVRDPDYISIQQAREIILNSKWTGNPLTALTAKFFALDTRQLGPDATLGERVQYEKAIFREYQWVPWPVYQEKRSEFLTGWANRFPEHRAGAYDCLQLLHGLNPRIAIYPGSFNPFHLGHLSVLRQAELSFDKVIVAVGINRQKSGSVEAMEKRHQAVGAQLPFHEVSAFDGLLSDHLSALNYPVSVVRGVRDGTDLEAELRFARFLGELRPGTPVVWIGCEPEYQHLSSSAIRELESFRPGAGERYIPNASHVYR